MDWINTLLDPSNISLIAESVAIVFLIARRFWTIYRENSGAVYRVRLCVEQGEFYRQVDSMLVNIGRKTFEYGKETYTIDSARIAFKDPAPTIFYRMHENLPLDFNSIRVSESKVKALDAETVDDLTSKKTLTQLINASKGMALPYTIIIVVAVLGIFIGLFLSPFIPIHFGK